MNTEQLKTDSELVAKKIISAPDNKPEHVADHKLREITEIVYRFASQESKIAVSEFKEKLKKQILRVSDSLYTSADHFKLSDHLNDLIDKL